MWIVDQFIYYINLYYFFFLPIQFTQEMKTLKNLQAPVLNYFWEQEGEQTGVRVAILWPTCSLIFR